MFSRTARLYHLCRVICSVRNDVLCIHYAHVYHAHLRTESADPEIIRGRGAQIESPTCSTLDYTETNYTSVIIVMPSITDWITRDTSRNACVCVCVCVCMKMIIFTIFASFIVFVVISILQTCFLIRLKWVKVFYLYLIFNIVSSITTGSLQLLYGTDMISKSMMGIEMVLQYIEVPMFNTL